MLQGDGEKQQDVPYSPPHPFFLLLHIVSIGGNK